MTMRCTLCGAQNPETAMRCQLCDTALSDELEPSSELSSQDGPIALETTDLSRTTLRWDRVGILLAMLGAVLLPWLLMSDLFRTPEDVIRSRQQFAEAKERYFAHREQWDQQKDQVLRAIAGHGLNDDPSKAVLQIEDLPLEVLIAYLVDELGLVHEDGQDIALYPSSRGDEPLLVLSTVDKSLWPLKVPVSLDVLLDSSPDKLSVKFVRLRRGTRSESTELAWDYFGPELQSLRRLESYAGGIRKLLLYQKKQTTDELESGIYVSWEYQHYPIRAG